MNIYINSLNLSFADRSDKMQPQNGYVPFTKENCTDGIYICTESNQLWLPQFFGLCTEKAKCIAFVKGDMKRMIALKGSDSDLQMLEDGVKVALEEYDTIEKAMKDNSGFENTEKLLKAGSKVAEFCKTFGDKWYIPTLNEMNTFFDSKKEIDAALTIAGGEPFFYGWHWTSTRYSSCRNWIYYWFDGDRDDDYQFGDNRVRPVSAF